MKTTERLSTITSVIGTAKRVPRSRIWCEGQRLIQAGFLPNVRYRQDWSNNQLTLTVDRSGNRKVSGKHSPKNHPVLDITGKKVVNTFSPCSHVEISFYKNVIVINRHYELCAEGERTYEL
jgi:hypothetical protein